MDLLYVKYNAPAKQARFILLLELGSRNGKVCGIISDLISDSERTKIRGSLTDLSQMSLERKVNWLKAHTPLSFRAGYREIKDNNFTIIGRYPVGRI